MDSFGSHAAGPEASEYQRPAKRAKKVLDMADLCSGNLEKYTVDLLTEAGIRLLGIKKLPKLKKKLIGVIQENLNSRNT